MVYKLNKAGSEPNTRPASKHQCLNQGDIMPDLAIPIPTELCNALRYEDGRLYWRGTGKEWGTEVKAGYKQGRFRGRKYRRGRVVWAVCNGGHIDRALYIDHINHIRDDDRIENLRLVTYHENSLNRKKYATNTSGQLGVSWSGYSWIVRIGRYGTDTFEYLGRFKSLDEAIAVRKAAEERLGYHDNHGC